MPTNYQIGGCRSRHGLAASTCADNEISVASSPSRPASRARANLKPVSRIGDRELSRACHGELLAGGAGACHARLWAGVDFIRRADATGDGYETQ